MAGRRLPPEAPGDPGVGGSSAGDFAEASASSARASAAASASSARASAAGSLPPSGKASGARSQRRPAGTRRQRLAATFRLWWETVRLQKVTREGWFYIGFTLVVGAAAVNTGNNLLHLVLGLQLSLLLLSALLSESVLRDFVVSRKLPRRGVAGRPVEVELSISNRKRRTSSYALQAIEVDGPAKGASVFAARIPPGGTFRATYRLTVPRRGEARFGKVQISTRFPFGLFEKNRFIELGDSLAVHPAGSGSPKELRLPTAGHGQRPEPFAGQGSEFHALRDLRPDDDPRQVHWRSTAKVGRPLVIERERERRRRLTVLVDNRDAKTPADLDEAAEDAIALSRRFLHEGCEVGLGWAGGSIEPGTDRAQLLRIGDALARLAPAQTSAPRPRVHHGAQGMVVRVTPATGPKPPWLPAVDSSQQAAASSGKGASLQWVQRASLLAASLTGFASLAVSGELAGWAMAIFIASAALGLAVKEGMVESFRIGANVLAIGALAVLALQVYTGTTAIIVAAPTFAVVLAASRLLGRRGPVDDSLLLLAALLMLAGGAALTGEFVYGLFFMAFAVSGTVALCLTQLRRDVEAVGGKDAAKARGSLNPALVSALAGLSVAVLVGSAMVFVFFPRVSTGLLLRSSQPQVGGGADRIDLGGVGVLKDNPTPAMRIHFPNGKPPGELYWRTTTFQRWEGKGWSRGAPKRAPVLNMGGVYQVRSGLLDQPTFEAEIELLNREPWLPTPGEPVEVRIPRRPRTPYPPLFIGEDGALDVAGEEVSRYTVKARRRPANRDIPATEMVIDSSLEPYLEIPEDLDPRIVALSDRFKGSSSQVAAIDAVIEYLGDEYGYTTTLPGDTPDPLSHFLFERGEGHCEYFATALTMLLRLQGIPARVATGYYGGSLVDAGDYFLVREGDAHAWTEAWLPGAGWVLFDATPAAERAGVSEGFVASAVELLDLVRYWWSTNVLDFDSATQRDLARGVADALAAQQGAGRSLTPIARFGVLIIVLALAAWLAFQMRGRYRELSGARALIPAQEREALRLFRTVKKRVSQQGVRLPPGASGADWAEAGAAALPEKELAIRRALAAYEATRFGGRGLSRAEARRLHRELRS